MNSHQLILAKRYLFVITAFSVCWFAKRTYAEGTVGASIEVAPPVTRNAAVGFGMNARAGYEVHLPLIFVTPEIGLGYHLFPSASGYSQLHLVTPYAGARLGLGQRFKPSVHAHVGGGYRRYDLGIDDWSLYLDGGAAIDIRVAKPVEVGLYTTVGWLPASPRATELVWVGVGLRAGVFF